jgi:hypothetical protein
MKCNLAIEGDAVIETWMVNFDRRDWMDIVRKRSPGAMTTIYLQYRGKIMTGKRVLTGISLLFVLATLAACGGGGGGGTGSPPPPASNTWDSMIWDQGSWG